MADEFLVTTSYLYIFQFSQVHLDQPNYVVSLLLALDAGVVNDVTVLALGMEQKALSSIRHRFSSSSPAV